MSQDQFDWGKLPPPPNDGGADHLIGMQLPDISLPLSGGSRLSLALLAGVSIIYAYPMTGHPDVPAPEGWDMIPGAKGCTPQSCTYRDHFQDLKNAGAANVFGLSTQDRAYQSEAVARMHLPFQMISDVDHQLIKALNLPTMHVSGTTLLRRLTMIIQDRTIIMVNYPVFPPDQDAQKVISWLQNHQK